MAIVVEKYSAQALAAVATVLADAFVTSPLHVSAFGPNRLEQNRVFFRIGLRHMFVGAAYVASVNGASRGRGHRRADVVYVARKDKQSKVNIGRSFLNAV